jgi:hypothetical protein
MNAIKDEHGRWVDEESGELIEADDAIEAFAQRLHMARAEQNGWGREVAKLQAVLLRKMTEAGFADGTWRPTDAGVQYRKRESSRSNFDPERVIAWIDDQVGSFDEAEMDEVIRAVSTWKVNAIPDTPLGDAIRRAITYSTSSWVEVSPVLRPAPRKEAS